MSVLLLVVLCFLRQGHVIENIHDSKNDDVAPVVVSSTSFQIHNIIGDIIPPPSATKLALDTYLMYPSISEYCRPDLRYFSLPVLGS